MEGRPKIRFFILAIAAGTLENQNPVVTPIHKNNRVSIFRASLRVGILNLILLLELNRKF